MEEGTELLKRLTEKRRPTFTSCCPAWINFAEKHYPDILPLLSSTRSPQQVLGAIAKTYLPEKMGLDPEEGPGDLGDAVHGEEGTRRSGRSCRAMACRMWTWC